MRSGPNPVEPRREFEGLLLLDETLRDRKAPPSAEDETDQPEQEPARVISCRRCGTRLSDHRAIMGPSQVFPNPLGQMKVIFTVRWAESVLAVSDGTTDFTWFDGYAWSIVCCAACQAHVGWRYDAVTDRSPPRFYGLLKSAVAETSGSPNP